MTKGLGPDGLDTALGRRGCQILQHLRCQESPSALLGSIHNLGKHTILSACNRNIPGNGGFSCLFMFCHFSFLPIAWTYTFFSINLNPSSIMGEKHADHTRLWLTRNASCFTLKKCQKAKSRHAYKASTSLLSSWPPCRQELGWGWAVVISYPNHSKYAVKGRPFFYKLCLEFQNVLCTPCTGTYPCSAA